MLIKVMAMGFHGKGTYLAESWNRLDFFIVVAGAVEYCLSVENMNLSAIRTIRVLRPLRAINRIPIRPITSYFNVTEVEKDYICSLPKDNGMHTCEELPPTKHEIYSNNALALSMSGYLFCYIYFYLFTYVFTLQVISLEGWVDIMYYVQDGHSFWDWIYFVLLIVIGSFFMINLCLVVIATQFSETKKREMERMKQERARYHSSSTLASGSDQPGCYAEILKYIAHLARKFKRKVYARYRIYRRKRNQGSKHLSLKKQRKKRHQFELTDVAEEREMVEAIPTLTIINNTGSSTLDDQLEARQASEEPRRSNTNLMPNLLPLPSSDGSCTPSTSRTRRSSVMFNDVVQMHGGEGDTKNVCLSEKTTQTDPEPPEPLVSRESPKPIRYLPRGRGGSGLTCGELLALSGALSAALPTHMGVDSRSVHTLYSSLAKGVKHFSAPSLFFSNDPSLPYDDSDDSSRTDSDWSESEEEWSEETMRNRPIRRWCSAGRKKVQQLVNSNYFQRWILCAILVNTLSMGVEYHNQPEELTQIVETSNMIFSGVFAFEMFLKIISEGPFGYISNGFNLFDGVIVVLGIVEMCQTYIVQSSSDLLADAAGSGSSLSVLRTFRLLRILKLVRFMPQLRRQLFVMLRTMDNVAIFFSLLVLFIFIFSVLGMYLFGGKFCMRPDGVTECSCKEILAPNSYCRCHRMHFNSLLWATVTVFQILTQEDWNVVLFNGMEKTSHWASLYFVALMTFGNYVLFNLLVAILVEGFSAEEEKKLSTASLESDEERRQLKTNQERVKENQLRQKLILGGAAPETKCNIEKEHQLLQLPSQLAASPPECVALPPPVQMPRPLITHTIATPQGSPHTSLDSGSRDLNNRLSPHLLPPAHAQGLLRSSSVRSNASHRSRHTRGRDSLSPHDLPRRYSLSPSLCYRERSHSGERSSSRRSFHRTSSRSRKRQNAASLSCPTSSSTPTSHHHHHHHHVHSYPPNNSPNYHNIYHNHHHQPHHHRHNHPTSTSLSPTSSFRQSRRLSASKPTSASALAVTTSVTSGAIVKVTVSGERTAVGNGERDAEDGGRHVEEETLNNNVTYNNNNLNNNQQIRRAILTQQNSIGSPRSPLSPQPSIRSAASRQPSLRGRTSVHGSIPERDFRPNNLSDVIKLEESDSGDSDSPDAEATSVTANEVYTYKIFGYFEPKGCFLERVDYSLYIFSETNWIRRVCKYLVSKKYFDSTVLFFIGLNCITLAMERPNIPPDSTERAFLSTCNDVFTVVFGLEMLIKVIAQGLLYGKDSYFSSGWNIMDGILVIVSVIDVLMSLIARSSPRIFGILRVFRLLRALRPLRVINRAPGLKLVVQTLLSSLQPIGNIVLICCTFFIIFGILGVQLFKGAFFYCDGPGLDGVETKADCLKDKRNQWVNRKYNFDNLGHALMSLFVLSSKDGWVNIMYTGLDAVGVDRQPKENYSQWRLLYFISFLLLVGFFVLNMFVGVVVENFHRCREEQEKEEKARRAAKRAKKLEKKRKKMREPPYYAGYSKGRLFVHNLVTSKYFDLAIAAVIGLNVVTMAMEFYKMPKIVARAIKCPRWNQLDVVIVLLSVAGIVLEEMKSEIIPINPTIIRVMRVLRIARVLKLLKMAKGIRALLDTVMQALPQVGNLGLLFFLLFFIFAALGVELFGRLECDDKHPCQGLGEHAHFKNFGIAFLTLFRVATGDNWNGIMKDTIRDECSDESDCLKNCCLYPFVAPIFFVIFVLMAQFVLVNVVVAVLMKHLEESHKLEEEEAMEAAALKRMEDEYNLEVEIERQLALEEEEINELQETLANHKLSRVSTTAKIINEVAQNRSLAKGFGLTTKGGVSSIMLKGGIGIRGLGAHGLAGQFFHKPLGKMSSLPDNFIFRGHRGSDPGIPRIREPSPIVTISELQAKVPSININGCNGDPTSKDAKEFPSHLKSTHNDPNLKKPSPEDPEHKISITDLRTSLRSSKPPPPGENVRVASPTSSPANSSPRSMSPIVLSSIATATVSFINSPRSERKVPPSPLVAAASVSPPSSPSLSLSQISPRSTTVLGPITRFTFGDSSSGTSIDAQTTGYSPESPRPPTDRKPSSPSKQRDSPSPSKIDNQSKAGEMSRGNASPLSQRAFKQLRWCTSSRKSAGAFIVKRKISREDSMVATLMTSLDKVPELGGHLDMDSTSCSLCSSGDDDLPSLPRGQSPSLFPRATPSSNTPSDSDAAPKKAPTNIQIHRDDDDDTLGSNSDYTIEGELDDQEDFLPSPSDPSYKEHPELQLGSGDVPSTNNLYSSELPTPCDNSSNCDASTNFATFRIPTFSDASFLQLSVQSSDNTSTLTPPPGLDAIDEGVKNVGSKLERALQRSASSPYGEEPRASCSSHYSGSKSESDSMTNRKSKISKKAPTSIAEFCSLREMPQSSSGALESQVKRDKCQSSSRKSSVENPTTESCASPEVRTDVKDEESSLPES
ncbi:voltage-dependent T-type calcium channel subunit alpha-1G [Hyalella azteca]|uniref:Voltage-dependent T-type calcium channel subunit alpha-1G n=1 Tax=Hyalella azteca TaxID=294128 RepID=A0A979FQW7_HYAAZ|nr:voltage-dependent T-type calcium channel subunit alpha-1G [Hyalella azteca]